MTTETRPDLTRYGWLAVATAVFTIALKAGAYLLTGSAGLLADAAESIVNLVAAIVALVALKVAAKPADKNHHFGHTKAEYFSAAVEGIMIFVAAASIIVFAVIRLFDPRPLEQLGLGIAISLVATLANGVVGVTLMRAGRRHNSITLRADGKHLMTDVYTSVGVAIGILLVMLTGWTILDPLLAIGVGLNILWAGYGLVKESTEGLMDISLPKEENQRLREILDAHTSETMAFHAIRTRESGTRKFMEMHMLVPGAWTVQQGHDAMEDLVGEIRQEFPDLWVTGHLEPIEDPRSYEDMDYDY
ncbi:cation transporter [Tessaracoccus rhinocerotis]|uniref:Cation transporter n=1 Tax=Tessaracoccus rhinocerotis TaxID=1689449 RepID=A0A553K5L6_9ACTN|nr:cation diffusion facilitator family transporter [Tessaracoccus rhinocerotis]TRY19999.1 cation transporter [Tessaracoccus rhinocerotis]